MSKTFLQESSLTSVYLQFLSTNLHLVSNRYCLRLKPKHFDISLFNWHWQWHIICFVFTEDAEDGPLRANIVDVAVPSALLGITWISLIIYVVFQKWRRNLKTTHQHDEKVNQLETQSLEQHYDDLQDIGEENNYSHLDRLDQETPYEETL